MISPNDVDKIRQLMQRVAKLETQSGSATRNIQRAPPAYLVVAPVGNIPAFVDPVPGQATCLMTRRFSNHDPANKELAAMSTKQIVYNLGEEIPSGEIVIAHRDAFGDLFIPASKHAQSLIPLTFTQTGGTSVYPADWTYTVADMISGDQLGTVINPTATPHHHKRPAVKLNAATAGIGYLNDSGNLVIMTCNEVPNYSEC